MSHQPAGTTANDEFSQASRPVRWSLARLTGVVLTQLLGLAVFVGFPALVTAIAPVSWVRLERHEDRVTATTLTCLLFVVPYRSSTIDPVVGFGDRFVGGTITRERRPGRDRQTKSEDEGFLVIQGPDQAAEVPVSPASLQSVIARAEAFLGDPQAHELRLFVVANWKFSVLMGGLISLLTVLYVSTIVLGVLIKLIHLLQGAAGVPAERRLLARQLNRR